MQEKMRNGYEVHAEDGRGSDRICRAYDSIQREHAPQHIHFGGICMGHSYGALPHYESI
jgi:hypothetical protein